MTQEEIRQKRAAIHEEAAELSEQLEIVHAKLMALQRRCTHPKLRTYSAMGELGKVCDDCGYQI